jgi:hypothetical protein
VSTRTAKKPKAAVLPPTGSDWLHSLAQRIDSLVSEDPEKKSAGAYVMRALVKEALKGNVRAIRECLMLAEKAAALEPSRPFPTPCETPRLTRKSGRPRVEIDLEQVQRDAYRTLTLTQCAAGQGIPKTTALGPVHGAAFRQAWEEGVAQRARETGEMAVLVQQGKVKLNQAQGLILMATLNKVLRWNKPEPEEQIGESNLNLTESLAEFLLRVSEKIRVEGTQAQVGDA